MSPCVPILAEGNNRETSVRRKMELATVFFSCTRRCPQLIHRAHPSHATRVRRRAGCEHQPCGESPRGAPRGPGRRAPLRGQPNPTEPGVRIVGMEIRCRALGNRTSCITPGDEGKENLPSAPRYPSCHSSVAAVSSRPRFLKPAIPSGRISRVQCWPWLPFGRQAFPTGSRQKW